MFRIFVISMLMCSIQVAFGTNGPRKTSVLIFCAKDCGGCTLEDGRAVSCGPGFNDENVAFRGELFEQTDTVDILFALEVICTNSDTCAAEREFGVPIARGVTSCSIIAPKSSPVISPAPIMPRVPEKTLPPSPPREVVETKPPEVDPYQESSPSKKHEKNRGTGMFLKPIWRQGAVEGGCAVSSRNKKMNLL